METIEQPKIVAENDTFQIIQECKQQCSSMGANSYEFNVLNDIEKTLKGKTIPQKKTLKWHKR